MTTTGQHILTALPTDKQEIGSVSFNELGTAALSNISPAANRRHRLIVISAAPGCR